jgi:ribonuclease HI
MKSIIIFTDGAARGNPGPGGWGSIVSIGEKVTEFGGGESNTTNNRMELTAVIEALKFVYKLPRLNLGTKTALKAVIYTDSSYVLNGATIWIHGWQRNNWKTKNKNAVLNQDLWEKLSSLLQKGLQMEWKLVKGHSGTAGNERCDVIATSYADGKKIKLYSGSRSKYDVDISVLGGKTKPKKTNLKPKNAVAYSYVSCVNGVVKTHTTWAECEKRVKGVSGAKFKKSFSKDDEQALIKLWSVKR